MHDSVLCAHKFFVLYVLDSERFKTAPLGLSSMRSSDWDTYLGKQQ